MPTTSEFIAGCITLYFGCTISAAGGVGGGGINVPILLIIFRFSFEMSVVFSLCVVLGNALAQTLLNLGKRHPHSNRAPLIFWELVIVLLPAQMGGSNIGSVLSNIFPVSILYILAFVVLLFASTISLRKGIHKWQEETIKLQHQPSSNNDVTTIENPMSSNSVLEKFSISENSDSKLERFTESRSTIRSKTEEILGIDGITWPTTVIGAVLTIWIVYISISIGLTLSSKCSTNYVIIFIFLYIPLFCATAFGVFYDIRTENSTPDGSSSDISPTGVDIYTKYNDENNASNKSNNNNNKIITRHRVNDLEIRKVALQLPIAAFFIGTVCSLLGIGGGELLGPLMLSYGVIPQVSSATTSIMSFMTTSSNLIQKGIKGEIPYGTGAILFFIGVFGGFSGRILGLHIAAKYGRPSVIILALVVALYLTCIYYLYQLTTKSFDANVTSFC